MPNADMAERVDDALGGQDAIRGDQPFELGHRWERGRAAIRLRIRRALEAKTKRAERGGRAEQLATRPRSRRCRLRRARMLATTAWHGITSGALCRRWMIRARP